MLRDKGVWSVKLVKLTGYRVRSWTSKGQRSEGVAGVCLWRVVSELLTVNNSSPRK